MSILIRKIPSQPFSLQEAKSLGISRAYIRKWLEEEKIERVSHGIYKKYSEEIDKNSLLMEASSMIEGHSAICLLSALEYYDLTDQISRKTWVMVEVDKKTSRKSIRLLRTRKPNWEIGIKKAKGFSITTLERTIIDCLVHRDKVGSSVAIGSLKKALRDKKTKISLLIKMAKRLDVWSRVDTILEVVAV